MRTYVSLDIARLVAGTVAIGGLTLMQDQVTATWVTRVGGRVTFGTICLALTWALAHWMRVAEVAALLDPIARRIPWRRPGDGRPN